MPVIGKIDVEVPKELKSKMKVMGGLLKKM